MGGIYLNLPFRSRTLDFRTLKTISNQFIDKCIHKRMAILFEYFFRHRCDAINNGTAKLPRGFALFQQSEYSAHKIVQIIFLPLLKKSKSRREFSGAIIDCI